MIDCINIQHIQSDMYEDQPFAEPLKTDSKHQVQRELREANSKILEQQIKTTNEAIKQISDEMKMPMAKKVYIPQQQEFSLIAGNNRSRSNNQTVKRTSPYTFATRQNTNLERTKDEIRIKIILENARLKNTIQTFKQDIDYYRENELKIIQILRESKFKISEYKDKLKSKSKKISQIIDSNISLKSHITQLQSKIKNMNSYSQWQDRQISELKQQIRSQSLASKEAIHKLQAHLRNFEPGTVNPDQMRLIEHVNHSPQGISSQTISQGTPYSIKQMQIQDIQSIKHYYYDEHEVNELKQANYYLKNRLIEVEQLLDQLRTESQLKDKSIILDQNYKQKSEGAFRDQLENIKEKSLQISQKLSQKQSSIENLERQLHQIRQFIKSKEEQFYNSEYKLKAEIIELEKIIVNKDHTITDLNQQIQENERLYKRQLEEIQLQIENQQEHNKVIIEDCERKNNQLASNLEQNEIKMQEIIERNKQLEQFKEENQDRIHQACNILRQRQQYENMCKKLTDSLEYYKKLPQDNLKCYEEKLSQTDKYIRQLEREKQELNEVMQRYAIQIRLLKNDIADLNREKNDSFTNHEEIGQIQEQKQDSSQGLPQLQSETSLMNVFQSQHRQGSKKDDQIVPIFYSHALEEQEELQNEQEDEQEQYDQNPSHLKEILRQKDEIIQHLKEQITELQQNFQVRLEQEIKTYTAQVVEANFKLDQNKETEKMLKQIIEKKQEEIRVTSSKIIQLAIQFEDKQQTITQSNKIIDQKDTILRQTQRALQEKLEQIKQKQLLIDNLEKSCQTQRNKNKESFFQFSLLIQQKSQLQDIIKKIKQQQQMLAMSKNQLNSSLQLELNQKRQIQSELMNSRRLAETVRSEHLSEKAMVLHLTKEIEQSLKNQKKLEENVKNLNSEKAKLHDEIIERMTEKDQFNTKYSKLQSQTQELKYYKRQALDQIQLLKKQASEMQTAQSTLRAQRQQFITKMTSQSNQLASKAQTIQNLTLDLNKAKTKIEELQRFQKKTKIQIQQNLTILSNIINQQKEQIYRLNFEKQQLITHKQTHIHSITELNSHKKKLQQSKDELEKQLHGEIKSNTELKNDIAKLHEQFDQHIEDNNKLKDKVVGCEQQIRRLKIQKDALYHQNQLLKRSNQQIRTRLQNNEKMIKDLSINIVGLKQSLQLSHSEHEDQVNFLKDSMNRSNQQSISLKLQQEQSRIGIGSLRQQLSQIHIKHKNVVQDYEHKIRSTSVKLEEVTKEKEGKITQLQSKMQSLRAQINEHVHAKQNFQTTIKQLNKVITDNHSNIQRLQAQLAEQKDIISSKDLVISSLQKNISIKKGQVQEKDKAIQELQIKITTVNAQLQQKKVKYDDIQTKLGQLAKQHASVRQKLQKDNLKLTDDIQISKKMLQEADQDHQMKTNKLNKDLSNYRMLLEQAQQESSFNLQQSNRSINQIKTELKIYTDVIKQKDLEIKQTKDANNQLKEQLEKLKVISSRFQEETKLWQQQKGQSLQAYNQLEKQLKAVKGQVSNLRTTLNNKASELQKISNELNNQRTKIKQLQNSMQLLASQKQMAESKLQKNIEQKSKLQYKLQTVALERNKLQSQCQILQSQNKRILKKNIDQSQEMQMSTMHLVQQRRQLQSKNQSIIKEIQNLKEQINMAQNKLHKQYQTRIENICLEQRQVLLDVQNKHQRQLRVHIQQAEKYKGIIQSYKEKQKGTLEQRQSFNEKYKAYEKLLKDSQNQRGQLTDKILQLTQQNNQSNQIIQNLRNNLVSKGNQIEECREVIYKLQQELEQLKAQKSPLNSSSSIPLSVEAQQKLADAYEYIDRLIQTTKQLKSQEQKLQLQLDDKSRVEKELYQRLQKLKERQTRQRNSSCDSWVSKSKIFDQKSQNLIAQLEQTKNRLSQAEAYILMLEQQEHKSANTNHQNNPSEIKENKSAHHHSSNHYEQRIIQLEKEIQNLKIQIQYQQAYINQLDNNSNLASSIRSKRSAIRSERGKEKENYQILPGGQDFTEKIYLLIEFIQTYTRDRSSGDKEQQLKSQLNHPALEDLLSTIFYRLQKQNIIHKEKEDAIAMLHEEGDNLHYELKSLTEKNESLMKKYHSFEQYQRKFEQSQKMVEELLTNKMKDEADIAECRSYIEQLENKLVKYEKGKQQPKKEGLQILEELNQSSSDSMMSESADSEIPSVNQSKEFRSSMDIRGKGNKLSMSKSIMRTKSNNINDQKNNNTEFLKRCLYSISELQKEVERIQKQLQQKNKLLNAFLGQSTSKQELINKLSLIESKIKMNDRQIKSHFQTSELQVAALIKDLLKYRQQKDQYGLQNQSRKRIEEYLILLEQQLTKNSKFYEEESVKIQETSRKSDSPNRLAGSLHQIKEDAVNEDKGSSIVNPKGGQVLRSFSNSQGVTQSLDINQVKNNYNEALRQLHQTHDELINKQEIIKNIQLKYKMVHQQVFLMLEDIEMSFGEDQYLIDQVENIKKFMNKYSQEEPSLSKIKDSQERIQDDKNNILVQSNQKNINNLAASSRKNQNPFERFLKSSQAQIGQFSQSISNENLKDIYRRIEEIMNERYDDCFDFLNTQKSLIADILKIRNDEAYLQSTMNKLASKLTKQQITEIITNSHNRLQANKTLTFILREEDAKSMVSDQHDFSPNGNKIQEVRNKVYNRPTELSLSIHNQLLEILAAPTRHQFYLLIEQFYKILKDFEDRFQNQLSEKDERSEKHSIRIKRVLQGPRQNLDFSREQINHLDVKHQKNRSSSCTVNIPQNSQEN